jgi:uncharacterized protein (TIGR03437 family)
MKTLAAVIVLALGASTPPLAAQCVFSFSPASVQVAASTFPIFQGRFNVSASASNCQRTAISNSDWLTVQVGQTGTGNGLVGYAVENNLTPVARSGTIAIGNAIFTVNQAANACRTTLALGGGGGVPAEGGQRILNVETTCQWTAVANVDWITLGNPNGTTGNGAVTLSIARNTTSRTRSGTVTVGGQSVVINQAAANCSYAFSPAAISLSPGGGQATAALTANCEWTAAATAAWLTVSPASGAGSATLTLSAGAAPAATEGRTASVTAGSASLSVSQPPAPCNTQLVAASNAVVPAAGGAGTLTVNTSCTSWTATSTAPWLRLSIAGNTVSYTADANPSAQMRTGEIRAGQAVVAVTQAGASCSYALSPEALELPAEASRGTVTVTAGTGCTWNAVSSAGWFRLGAVVVGQSFAYEVDANPSADARTAAVSVAARTLSVRQAGASNAPRIASAGVVNAASYAGGGVAPGEILVIFGQNLGPAQLAGLELTGDGRLVATQLAQTRVLFDGIAAPLIYSSAGQVSVVAPYAIAGRGTVNLQTEYRGVRSNAIALTVLEAKPALFTRDSSGTGAAALLNEDGGVNGLDRPARAGSVIVLFGTGEGLPDPVPPDGAVTAGAPLPRPRQTVQVLVDGQPAEVLYAGAAPSLVAGVLQLNVRLPAGVSGNAVPVRVSVGAAASNVVTVSIR